MFAEDEQDSFLLAHVQHCDTTVPAQLAMHILCKALLSPWIYISSFALEDPAKKWDQDNSDNQTWPVDKYQKCCAGQNPSNTEGWGIPGVGWTWRTRGDSDSTKWHKNNDPPPRSTRKWFQIPGKSEIKIWAFYKVGHIYKHYILPTLTLDDTKCSDNSKHYKSVIMLSWLRDRTGGKSIHTQGSQEGLRLQLYTPDRLQS